MIYAIIYAGGCLIAFPLMLVFWIKMFNESYKEQPSRKRCNDAFNVVGFAIMTCLMWPLYPAIIAWIFLASVVEKYLKPPQELNGKQKKVNQILSNEENCK